MDIPVWCRSPRTGRDVVPASTLDELVTEYLHLWAPAAAQEEAFFGDQALTSDRALARAGRSLTADGTLHPHQRRIGHVITSSIPAALAARGDLILSSATFEQLLGETAAAIGNMSRVGELAIYDIAHRIGCWLGLAPERVYLHCGTRSGARALGLRWRAPSLHFLELPPAIRRLTPAQSEDFLCLFKDRVSAP